MKTFSHHFQSAARLLPIAVLAGVCLIGSDTQAATLTSPNSAPTSPVNIVTAPAAVAAQVQAAVEQDIRDIRPPYHFPPGWLWLAWTAGGLALVALGYGTWRWCRRFGVRVKPPYEIALERLEEARRLMQPEQARAFSIAVSEVVRDYIEKCFPVRAAHHTTEEFLRNLATRPDSPLMAHQPVLADFLVHCDLAKFARWILSARQMEAMLQSASAFIVATGKPVAEISPVHAVGTPPPPPSPGTPVGAPASISSPQTVAASVVSTLNPQSL
jgi:hypothetical protein